MSFLPEQVACMLNTYRASQCDLISTKRFSMQFESDYRSETSRRFAKVTIVTKKG